MKTISYLIDKIDQCYIKSTNRCKNNASEDAFVFIHDIGNKTFKTWNNTTAWMELSPEFTVTKEVELQKGYKFQWHWKCRQIHKKYVLFAGGQMVFSLGSSIFAPGHLPIDSAQNEWNNLILIIKRYLQTQFDFNPETFRIFLKQKSDVLVISIFTVRIFFRLFWRHQCMQRSV